MNQDIPNENSGDMNWKNKLEDNELLSTATLTDKNEAWEKLHDRLHQKPRLIRAVWYWAAAACLLAAMIVSLLTVNKQQAEIVTAINHLPPSETNKTVAQQQLAVKENILSTVTANTKTAVIQTGHSINNKKINSDTGSLKLITALTKVTEQKDTAVKTITLLPVQIPVMETKNIASVTEKKKLKVVHINELGDPIPATFLRRIPDDYSVIQFRLINQQVYSNPPVPSGSFGFNTSKSKNTSPN
jgi:hypothetical protein